LCINGLLFILITKWGEVGAPSLAIGAVWPEKGSTFTSMRKHKTQKTKNKNKAYVHPGRRGAIGIYYMIIKTPTQARGRCQFALEDSAVHGNH
jgi:hypothetical protein